MFDLHVHTTASDGDLDAKQIIEEAKRNGLTKIAITDHDTIGNVSACVSEGKKNGILVIPGIEISAEVDKGEMHILGYGFDINNKEFNQVMEILREARMEKNRKMIEILRGEEFGFDITLEDVQRQSVGESLGRPHFAKAMIEKGIVSSVPEAFKKYLCSPQIEAVKRKVLKPQGAIELINRAGGIAVLAHPHTLKLSYEETYEKIKELKSYGLAGIEAYHSDHSKEQVELYKNIANKLGLVVTCGSDYHGPVAKPKILLGRGIDNNLPTTDERIFRAFYDKLQAKEAVYK